MRRIAALMVVTLVALPLSAQTTVRSRLEGRVPPAIFPTVEAIVAAAAERELPAEPLIQKALEGAAKGVPVERIVTALEQLSTRLAAAADAIEAAGAPRSAGAIEAGAFALTAGLSVADIRAMSAVGVDAAISLRVAGTLSAIGVPPSETVALIVSTAQGGSGDLTALPQTVQAAITRGASPAQAARLAQGSGGGRAQPPGPPPDRPARPEPKKP